jgi:hypothetical protein
MPRSTPVAATLVALAMLPAVADEGPMHMSMPSAFGPYGMTREGSGTA